MVISIHLESYSFVSALFSFVFTKLIINYINFIICLPYRLHSSICNEKCWSIDKKLRLETTCPLVSQNVTALLAFLNSGNSGNITANVKNSIKCFRYWPNLLNF